MSTGAWVAVIVVVVLLVLVLLLAVQKRNTRERVVNRFGPEYDRAVERHGDRRAAEHDLLDRAKRRDRLDIRPLSQQARDDYARRWQVIQIGFVDDPRGSIFQADQLLDAVMRDRGYPVEDFDQRADLVSVDHPSVVQNYRAARTVSENARSQRATTEGMRDALLNYRALFDELLQDDANTTR